MTLFLSFFFFNDTATTEIYTLSLHDALPISATLIAWTSLLISSQRMTNSSPAKRATVSLGRTARVNRCAIWRSSASRSEEHTSELQSRQYLVCRLLLEKKKMP